MWHKYDEWKLSEPPTLDEKGLAQCDYCEGVFPIEDIIMQDSGREICEGCLHENQGLD